MPYICYVEKNFHRKSNELIKVANGICHEYMKEGYTLTLRQLYYQFVARGIIENSMSSYNNLGNVINDARLAGLIDWDAIEDRTRNLERQPTWDTPKDILKACAEQFKYDYWKDQDYRVEVWVEKEALAGVIERTAFKYRCAYFSCRGYSSQSELWRAGQRFKDYYENGQSTIVIHLGDHDPSGIDMTRDNDDRLRMFGDGANIEVVRIALNMDQVDKYNPPPNPAKVTDKRFAGYAARFGEESWELDALDPKVIDNLISTEIEKYIDWNLWDEVKEREDKARARIEKLAKNWKEV